MEVSVPDLQHSRGWMETLGDREQSQGAVALAFGARSPTSRLQSKCIKPAVRAKFSPGFYLVWPIQVLISFNYLKTFKNLENLSKHLTFWLVLKILASFNTPLPGNHWLEMRTAVFGRTYVLHFVTIHTIPSCHTLPTRVPCLAAIHRSFW